MLTFLWVVIAYLVGSIPFGLVLSRLLHKGDPRKSGSGNVGATNIARTHGKTLGVLTLLLDLLKGFFVVFFAARCGLSLPEVSIVALAVVCGHVFSLFLRFKGGKGVATYVGAMLALAFWQAAVAGIVCLVIAFRTGFVSLGALVMVCLLPVLLLVSSYYIFIPVALALAVLIFWTHRQNIQRLRTHTEKPWNKKV